MRVGGSVTVPGDKSITHRVLRQLGARVSALKPGSITTVRGSGKLQRSAHTLNCGNSGTTTRLLLGLLAAHRFSATLTGDSSLRRRPMRRVTTPLSRMGAHFVEQNGDGLPLTVTGGPLRALQY